MIIADDWKIDDAISGLRITVLPGKVLDRLLVEHMTSTPPKGMVGRYMRDFWFTKQGKFFDGTGTALCPEGEET
jgi:hypothetical protein